MSISSHSSYTNIPMTFARIEIWRQRNFVLELVWASGNSWHSRTRWNSQARQSQRPTSSKASKSHWGGWYACHFVDMDWTAASREIAFQATDRVLKTLSFWDQTIPLTQSLRLSLWPGASWSWRKLRGPNHVRAYQVALDAIWSRASRIHSLSE